MTPEQHALLLRQQDLDRAEESWDVTEQEIEEMASTYFQEEKTMAKTEHEIELEWRINALEIETEALKAVVEYLLWAREYSLSGVDGEARGEARSYGEKLQEEWQRAAERR